ncbi:anterior gradient 1 [Takifugu rubripes]|uniref:Anterior gradient 1 n=1 Tax=Takifugu rubripes TaxID=31033 RepID=H2SVF0_TAKRU|nr:anterior gradient protein 3-like [Takifugu rubripes]|eukprot:XP_003962148.1 PREDICTED: anterior gradient protein 3 homolog [Takifugu rubripes]
MLRSLLVLVLCVVCASTERQRKKKANPVPSLARGWGENLEWAKSYEEGLAKMVKSGKPLMVIHHKEDCQFSQALKKVFAAEKSIQKMGKEHFVMLNTVEETWVPNMTPDGSYVPRILFVDPSMTVRTEIKGKYSNRQYTYEPGDMAHLLQSMKQAKVRLHTEF